MNTDLFGEFSSLYLSVKDDLNELFFVVVLFFQYFTLIQYNAR